MAPTMRGRSGIRFFAGADCEAEQVFLVFRKFGAVVFDGVEEFESADDGVAG